MIIRARKWFSDMFFVEGIIAKWFWHILSSLNITFCWLCKDEVIVKHIGHNQDCMHYTKPVNDANDVTPPAHFDHCVGPKRTLYWSSAAFRSQLCLRGRDGIPHGGGVEEKNMTFAMNGVRSFFKIDPEVNKVEYSNVLDIHLVAPFCAHLDGFCILWSKSLMWKACFFQTSVISWPLSHQNHVTDPHEADITPGESTRFSRKPYAAATWKDQKFTLVPILVGGLMTEKARTRVDCEFTIKKWLEEIWFC